MLAPEELPRSDRGIPPDESRNSLVERHLGLVALVVSRMSEICARGRMDREDAFGYGVEGLIQAANRFDETQGVSFASFAVPRIRGAILDAVRRLDPLPRPLRKRLQLLEAANIELAHAKGYWPSARELAIRTGLTEKQVDEVMSARGFFTRSLEALNADPNGESVSLDIEDHDENGSPDAILEKQALSEALVWSLQSLSEREQRLLELRYIKGMAFKEIGRELGMSESGACQFNQRIVARLQRGVQSRLDDAA